MIEKMEQKPETAENFYCCQGSNLEDCEKRRRVLTGWGYQATEKAAVKDTRSVFVPIVHPVRAAL